MWESHSIIRYLAAKSGQERYWPLDAARRSLIDRWMDWSQTSLQPDFLNGVFWGFYRTPEHLRNMSAVSAKIDCCTIYMELLDNVLSRQPYLSGDEFGLADIPAGTVLYRYFGLEIPRPEVPNVTAWFQRLQSRLPYKKHVMIPFDDLKGKLDF